ncbi:hypothetical protein HQ39_05285 [Porphyromonas sp. COT-108 OH2963]|uniref:DUF4369 domain-containing protein n=1 Tax=Porphyromonas sp. COT-108 OH2963 TaxID=1515614 RepID=UPI00052B5CF5|nr:DUF4369 domain-containing protein [Porphyromonas sp. COT-108 OH2963]KGN95650.1 hypothetical protein HQ39_05285 [Porphyromonas sp. COT-108 OH2963]
MKHSLHTAFSSKLFLLSLLALFITSCTSNKKSIIDGHVRGAEGKTIYLEQRKLSGVEVLDSVKLHANGSFKFTEELGELPEFYRLRVENQVITLAIDTISHIRVETDYSSFATGYTVEGSATSEKVKEIFLAQLDANVGISKDLAEYVDGHMPDSVFQSKQKQHIEQYKEVAIKYIYEDPASLAAYYALFQELGGYLIFNIYEEADSKLFAIVATAFDAEYPDAERSKHLHKLALQSIAAVRSQKNQQQLQKSFENSAAVVGYLEVSLPNAKGDTISLSSVVGTGEITLLSFTAMGAEWSAAYCESIDLLYQNYHNKGLRIYQVGLERDGHIWYSTIQNYPWVNVQDTDGVFSKYIGLYNLNTLPTMFLIKDGELKARFTDFNEVLATLDKWL